ncbi:hypothetical protein MNB_SM-3-576 [hydrothermal vent metagenome]|uniref:Uncharacterized protein n=1 Tax=hydrothermal vent metagenome TaxID=652676 RepID=A0A1W1D202_9ZZZZ
MRIFIFFLLFLELQAKVEFTKDYDIYYSNISAYIYLDSAKKIEDASFKGEREIYKDLISKTFDPNIFLVEAAIHPLPIFGVYMKSKQKATYKKIEPIKAVTAGFEEPYSLSFFFGRMISFQKANEELSTKNRAFIGYLFSIGDYTIKNNSMYQNKWVRTEFKLKGTRKQKVQSLDWSFRIGTQINQSSDFANTFYFGVKRSRIDYKKTIYSFIYNSAYEALFEFNYDFALVKSEVVFEKEFPIDFFIGKFAFSLGVGYIYDSFNELQGNLKDIYQAEHRFIIRPNIRF